MSIRKIATAMRREESGAAMVIALLFATVMLAFIASMTAVAIRSSSNTAATKDGVLFAQAADAAIANAILLGNKGGAGESLVGYTQSTWRTPPQTSNYSPVNATSTAKSSWYVTKLENDDYVLYAAGYRNSPQDPDAVVLKVGLKSLNMTNTYLTEDGVRGTRASSLERIMGEGVFASDEITVSVRGAAFRQYSEDNPQANSPYAGDVSTNGKVRFPIAPAPSFAPVGKVNFYAGAGLDESTIGTRCYGENPNDDKCYTGQKAVFTAPFLISDKLAMPQECTEMLKGVDQYNDGGAFYRKYHGNAVLTPNVPGKDILCLSKLSILNGAKVTIPSVYTEDSPLTIYIEHGLDLAPGTQLSPATTPLSSPSALRIYSPQSTKFYPAEQAGTGNITITANMVLPQANCTLGKGGNHVKFRGSLACKTITLNSAETLLYTDPQKGAALRNLSGNNIYAWSSTSYKNVEFAEAKLRFN